MFRAVDLSFGEVVLFSESFIQRDISFDGSIKKEQTTGSPPNETIQQMKETLQASILWPCFIR